MGDVDTARQCAAAMYAKDAASKSLGIEVEIPAAGSAVATMQVRDDMVNGFGVCHGGLVFTLADTAFAFACNAYDRVTVAAAAGIDFLRPAHAGDELTATAAEDYRGSRSGFYTIRVTNQDDAVVAVFRGRSVSKSDTKIIEEM